MRLALIGPSWPFRGGIAQTTTALAKALAVRGSLHGFYVPKRQYPRWLYPGGRDVDEWACARLEQAVPAFSVLEPWTWPRLFKRLARGDFDALVVPYWTYAWAPLLLALIHYSRKPVIAIVHNPADHNASITARLAAKAVLSGCRGFLCHADSVKTALQKFKPGKPTKINRIPCEPVSTPDRDRARAVFGLADSTLAILFFGLIRPYKGVDVLLDAVAKLPANLDCKLLLAGEPWGQSGRNLRERLAAPDLYGRVHASLEWIGEKEASHWFAAADVLVLPYRSATGSAVAAQGQAWGLPIVCSAVGGLVEVVADGESGVLVPPDSAADLALALARLGDQKLRLRLAQGARTATTRVTWDAYAATLEQLVLEVLAEAKGSSQVRKDSQ